MGKVVPLGGKHKSVSSLLAEIISDVEIEKCVIVALRKDGEAWTAHYEMTRADMCYAAALLQRLAFEE